MGQPANKNITIKHPFHVQWACRQIKLYYKIPISHAMGLAGKQNFTIKTLRTPILQAMGLPGNRIITIKSHAMGPQHSFQIPEM